MRTISEIKQEAVILEIKIEELIKAFKEKTKDLEVSVDVEIKHWYVEDNENPVDYSVNVKVNVII